MTANIGIRLLGAAILSVALAACAGGPSRLASPAAATGATAAEADIDAAMVLLEKGDEGSARKKLKAVLKRDPMNSTARLLKDSIDSDPMELLGPGSYAYKVRPGDTLSGLSQRLLGNRLKWYQLGRYNGLKTPFVIVVGQTLRIPGQPPAPPPVVKPRELARPAADALPQKGTPKSEAPAAVTSTNSIAARAARDEGLVALNRGDVARAVQQLRRAAVLDPGNALIARDLARAERLARTVKARQ